MENLKCHSLSVGHNSMSAWVLTSQNAHPSSTKPARAPSEITRLGHAQPHNQNSPAQLSPQTKNPTGKRSQLSPQQGGRASPGHGEWGCPLHTRRGRPEGREPRRWEPRLSRPAKPAPRTSKGQQHPVLSPGVSLTSQGRSGLACLGLQSRLFTRSQHACPPPASPRLACAPGKCSSSSGAAGLAGSGHLHLQQRYPGSESQILIHPSWAYPNSGTKSSSAKSSQQLEKAQGGWRRRSVGALWGEDACIRAD